MYQRIVNTMTSKTKTICNQCNKSISTSNISHHRKRCGGLSMNRALEYKAIVCSGCLRQVRPTLFKKHIVLYGHEEAIMMPINNKDSIVEELLLNDTSNSLSVDYKGVPNRIQSFGIFIDNIKYLISFNRLGQSEAQFLIEHLYNELYERERTSDYLDELAKRSFPLLVDCGVIPYRDVLDRRHNEISTIMMNFLIGKFKELHCGMITLNEQESAIVNRFNKHIDSVNTNKMPCVYCSSYISRSNIARHNKQKHSEILICANTNCVYCGKSISKANIARHESKCINKYVELKIDINKISPYIDHYTRGVLDTLVCYYNECKPEKNVNFFNTSSYKSKQKAYPLHLTGEQGVGKTSAIHAMLKAVNVSPNDPNSVVWITREQWNDINNRKNLMQYAKTRKCLYVFDNVQGWSARIKTFYDFEKIHPFVVFITTKNNNLSDKYIKLNRKYKTVHMTRLPDSIEVDILYEAMSHRYNKRLIKALRSRSPTMLSTASNLLLINPDSTRASNGVHNVGMITSSTVYRYCSDAAVDAITHSRDNIRLALLDQSNHCLTPMVYTTGLHAKVKDQSKETISMCTLTTAASDYDILECATHKNDQTETINNEIYKDKMYDTVEFDIANYCASDSIASSVPLQRMVIEINDNRIVESVNKFAVLRSAYKPIQDAVTMNKGVSTSATISDYNVLKDTLLEDNIPDSWSDTSTQAMSNSVGIDINMFGKTSISNKEFEDIKMPKEFEDSLRWSTSKNTKTLCKDERKYGDSGIDIYWDIESIMADSVDQDIN